MDAEYAAAYPDLYKRHWWWRAREEVILDEVSALCPRGPSDTRILDVGCGAGLFFDALEKYGAVEGIESEPDAVARSGRWRSRITVGELDDTFGRTKDPFDVVLLLDVLEHIDDPGEVLRHVARVLRPGGSVVTTVPAFSFLWTGHDEINHHRRRYSRTQMIQLLESAGFVVASSRYLFPSLVMGKLAVKVREKVLAQKGVVPEIPTASLNALLQGWFRIEHRLARRAPFGTSVMVVATADPASLKRSGHA